MTNASKRYYFAYGSNMDQAQMNQICPRAVLVGIAKLQGYRFIINTRGVATVVPERSSEVCGIPWIITKVDEQALDKHEGVKWGTYTKRMVHIEMATERSARALTYIASDSTLSSPRDNYMEKLVAAAEQYGLPDKYVEELRSWLKTGD